MPSLLRCAAAAGALILAATVTGCTDRAPGEPTDGLAVVLGAHANMPPAALAGIAAQALTNAVDTQALVATVVADGAPFVLGSKQLKTTGKDTGAWRASEEDNRRTVEHTIATAAARSPETDLLAALRVAAQQIAATPGRHTVLVVDSGLSTAGPLDFRQPGLLDADPNDVVTSLRSASALPDLKGLHLVFQGLGDTAAPQPALGGGARTQLIDLWVAVALGAGALDVNVERTPLRGNAKPGLPPVSVIGAGSGTAATAGGGVTCTATTMVLSGGNVAFQADTAAFRDPAAAAATLRPIAEQLTATGASATLTGTTADVGDKEGQRRLSQERAAAVAALLRDLGVPVDRLTVVGLGSDFPGYVPDHDARGNLLPSAAALNRKVVIKPSGSAAPVCG